MCCTLSPFFPHNLHRGAFTGLIDVVLHIVCSCAPRNNAFVSTFKSPLDNQCHVFSLSNFSVVSLMNYPRICFPLNFSFSSFAFCFLNSTLVIVSLLLIVSAVNTSTLIKPLPHSFLFTYNLLRCSSGVTLHTLSFFLDFLSKSFSSLAFQLIIPVPYLNFATAPVCLLPLLYFSLSI